MAYGRKRVARRSTKKSRIRRVRGRGGYWQDFGRQAFQGGGAALGAGLGSFGGPVGSVIGGAAGGALGNTIAGAVGLGGYRVKKNAFKLDEGFQVPTFSDMSQGVVITHREYFGDLVVPGTPGLFTTATYPLNPGMSNCFPWLSTIARCFDQYQWRGLLFEFKSTSADVGSTTALGMGTVIMSTDYDAADLAPLTKVEMENGQYTCSTRPSVSMIHAIECDPKVTVQPMLYIRSGAIPTTKALDIRFYDHGNMTVATSGLPTGSTGTIGELWCTYKVALYKPQISEGDRLTDKITGTTGIDATHILGTNFATDVNSSLGGTVDAGGIYSFPISVLANDEYLVVYLCVGNATVLTNAITTTLVGCSLLTGHSAVAGVTSTVQASTALVRITATNGVASISFNSMTLPTAITAARLYVTKIDSDITYP